AAVDAPRIHHQWLPDEIAFEEKRISTDVIDGLKAKGHTVKARSRIGVAQIIVVGPDGALQGGADTTRWAESTVAR
ncbi:MAG: gamma-glutamyltransferase, partial [Holophaga sp.]|nr:gamma-glutamyltransferase [Holophaga sp.]